MNNAESDTEHSVPDNLQTDVKPPQPADATETNPAQEPVTGEDNPETNPAQEPATGEDNPESLPEDGLAATTPDEQKPETQSSDAYSITRTRGPLTSPDLERVGVVKVELTLNVGSKSMTITDVLNLERGSVVTLDRREHDPLDVLINGVVFARGEVVRTGDCYGLRILEIL